jgi:protein-L-isoaspartate O-methyltransferase
VSQQYIFGDRAEEQRRLDAQASLLNPATERFFRASGIGPGMRVLDLGSGAGHVAVLASRLVGPDGSVLGVERDPAAVASARDMRALPAPATSSSSKVTSRALTALTVSMTPWSAA